MAETSPESEAKVHDLFVRVATSASHSCRLGIFSLECAHRYNQTVSQSSQNLGNAKAFSLISANAVLNSVMQKHKTIMRVPKSQTKKKDRRQVIKDISKYRKKGQGLSVFVWL